MVLSNVLVPSGRQFKSQGLIGQDALQPFGQVVTESPYAQVGTGLGLPIVISLVELHGGRFAIDSAPNMGTTVTLILPRRQPPSGSTAQPA